MTNKTPKRNLNVSIYSSFEDENRAEHRRLASMTPAQRWDEFAVLQERVWGEKWKSKRMSKIARYEKLNW